MNIMPQYHIENLSNIIYKAINEAVSPKKYNRFYVEEVILQDTGARLPQTKIITDLSPIKRVRATTTFDDLVEKQFKAVNQRIKKGDITLKKTWYNTETLCIYLYDFQEFKSAKIWIGYNDRNVIVSKKFMNAGLGWNCETNNELFNEIKNYYTELKDKQKTNSSAITSKKFKIDYYPTWDRGMHNDLQHEWVYAQDKNDAYYVAREEIDDLSEIIQITEIR